MLPAPELDAARPAPGGWTFRVSATGSAALFGMPGQDPRFAVRCDPQSRRIVLARAGRTAGAATLRIVTADAAASFPAAMADPAVPLVEAAVPTGLTVLDALARADALAVSLNGDVGDLLPGDPAIGRAIGSCRPGG